MARQRHCRRLARNGKPGASLLTPSSNQLPRPARKAGFSTFESRSGRETDCLLEGDGFKLSVPRQKDSVFEAPSQNYQAVLLCRREVPAYFLFGTESEPPPNSQQKFLANWWFTGDDGGRMKQSTSFPVISFGTAAVTLYTSKNSPLGDLIGGNSDSDFTFLSVRGVYPAATMTVTFKSSGDK